MSLIPNHLPMATILLAESNHQCMIPLWLFLNIPSMVFQGRIGIAFVPGPGRHGAWTNSFGWWVPMVDGALCVRVLLRCIVGLVAACELGRCSFGRWRLRRRRWSRWFLRPCNHGRIDAWCVRRECLGNHAFRSCRIRLCLLGLVVRRLGAFVVLPCSRTRCLLPWSALLSQLCTKDKSVSQSINLNLTSRWIKS